MFDEEFLQELAGIWVMNLLIIIPLLIATIKEKK